MSIANNSNQPRISFIDKAKKCNACFFAFRSPHKPIFYGIAKHISEGIKPESFIISPFDNSLHHTYSITTRLFTKDEAEKIDCDNFKNKHSEYIFPYTESTSKDNHKQNVNHIKKYLSTLKENGKVVLSRVIIQKTEISLSQTFNELCRRYPDAYVFCFNTPQTGSWIGASPELLININEYALQSISLAGTKAANSDAPWDNKNIAEQQIVTQYIYDTIAQQGITPIIGKRYTKTAGPVAHLCTPIYANIPSTKNNTQQRLSFITELLKQLSPTPALGGYPKANAIRLIRDIENHDRQYYGGFIGYISEDVSNADFFVNLRSMNISENQLAIFAGGGITSESDADEEWKETERKSTTLLSVTKIGK